MDSCVRRYPLVGIHVLASAEPGDARVLLSAQGGSLPAAGRGRAHSDRFALSQPCPPLPGALGERSLYAAIEALAGAFPARPVPDPGVREAATGSGQNVQPCRRLSGGAEYGRDQAALAEQHAWQAGHAGGGTRRAASVLRTRQCTVARCRRAGFPLELVDRFRRMVPLGNGRNPRC